MYLHHLTRRSLQAATLALVTALAACGGGGSDRGTPVTPAGQGTDPATNPPPAATFTIALSTQKAVILQGTSVEVDATVTRSAGFDAAIELAVTGLPNGVTAAPVSVAKGAATAKLTLTAGAAAPHSLPTSASVNGSSGTISAQQGVTVTVRGVAGSIDTSFGTDGKTVTAVGPTDDSAQAMAVQADGKLVVVGYGNTGAGTDFELVRLQRDGAIDTTFGINGKVTTDVSTGSDVANAVAIQADGKIVVAGSADVSPKGKSFAVVRYNADGSLDGTFGNGGKVTTDVSTGSDVANAVAIQADGKIVVAGSVDVSPKGKSFAVVRYNTDGSLDGTFGDNGKVITSFGSASDEAFAVVVQADGKIVLGGHYRHATQGMDFALARYETNGTLDFGFGVNGLATAPIRTGNSRDSIYGMALQTIDGEQKIVAVGGEGDFALNRFNANGTVDNTFRMGQSLYSEFGTVIGAARAVQVSADNKIIVAGHANNDFALLQLNADGTNDTTFGNNGAIVTKVSATNWNTATAVVRQDDGKVVVGGWVYAGNSSSADFVVARYTTAGVLDDTFGTAGLTITPVAPGTKDDAGRAILLQIDDRVPTVRSIVAGSANDSNYDFAVTRYWH